LKAVTLDRTVSEKERRRIIKFNYGNVTVWKNGRLVMKDSEVIDKEWWERKISRPGKGTFLL